MKYKKYIYINNQWQQKVQPKRILSNNSNLINNPLSSLRKLPSTLKPTTSSSSTSSISKSEKIEVTVIPVDEEPYSKLISIPASMLQRKDFSYINNE